MQESSDWAVEIAEKVKKTSGYWEKDIWNTIYRIPEDFRNQIRREDAYLPQVVSLGPYHHDGNPHLKRMEVHKERAFVHFQARSKQPFHSYVLALKRVVEELMHSYNDLDEHWRKDETRFLQLMILDGCFMIEVLRTSRGQQEEYASNDPIFSLYGMLHNKHRIRRDMLLIENQIPLLVLHALLSVEQGIEFPVSEVNNMVLDFFELTRHTIEVEEYLGVHVLDVVRRSMIKGTPSRPPVPLKPIPNVVFPATDLHIAGIRFQRSMSQRSLGGFNFQSGILSLPMIDVDETTESKFLNLITYEKLHPGLGNEITSYVCFMGSIIDSEKDALLLTESQIIKNFLRTDGAVVQLFRGLAENAAIDPDSIYGRGVENIHRYLVTWRVSVRRTYFRSRWSQFAFVAAVLGLLITLFQLLYALLSFHVHGS